VDDHREGLINDYLREIAMYPPISTEDVHELLVVAGRGDKTARRALIQSHLELAADLATRLAPRGMDQLEAIQEANLALMRCVEAGLEPAISLGSAIRSRFDELEPPV
jgi:DNA-directed RNA polymerase sigma subunit (sigma70/sigma32)